VQSGRLAGSWPDTNGHIKIKSVRQIWTTHTIDDWNFDLRFSFGSRLKNVDKPRAAGVRRPLLRDALESDCEGGDFGRTVLLRTDCSEVYLDLLTDPGGQPLSIVREIEGQHLLFYARRGNAGLLSFGVTARGPQEGQRYQGEC
jgi:hypothetical protein